MDSFQNQVRTETGFDITNTLSLCPLKKKESWFSLRKKRTKLLLETMSE